MSTTGAPVTPWAARPLSTVELAQEAAEAIGGLVHVTTADGDPDDPGIRDPANLRRTLDELAILALRLAQAVEQMTGLLAQHAAGHLAIEAGTEHAEHAEEPGRAVAAASDFLETSGQLAEQLGAALDRASRALAHASYSGPGAGAGSGPDHLLEQEPEPGR